MAGCTRWKVAVSSGRLQHPSESPVATSFTEWLCGGGEGLGGGGEGEGGVGGDG